MITVAELRPDERGAWDAYVRGAPGGLPMHLSGWQEVLARTHGYETHFLMARQNGRVAGVLPLFFIQSRWVGNAATTLPGGLCADGDEVARALLARAVEVGRDGGMRRLVLQDGRRAWSGAWRTTSDHVDWRIDVRPDPEALWRRLQRNVRRQVRLAISAGLAVEIDRSGHGLDDFYAVFSQFTRQVGTPVFGRSFLQNVVDVFPGQFSIALVRRAGLPIGAFFQLELGRTVYGMWGATLHPYLPLRPNYLLYWELLNDTSARGFHTLDMGRSPARSGASAFKGQWGGECRPVYQQVAALGRPTAGDAVARPLRSDGQMRLVRRIWPLLPAPLATYLGPKLRRHVPFA